MGAYVQRVPGAGRATPGSRSTTRHDGMRHADLRRARRRPHRPARPVGPAAVLGRATWSTTTSPTSRRCSTAGPSRSSSRTWAARWRRSRCACRCPTARCRYTLGEYVGTYAERAPRTSRRPPASWRRRSRTTRSARSTPAPAAAFDAARRAGSRRPRGPGPPRPGAAQHDDGVAGARARGARRRPRAVGAARAGPGGPRRAAARGRRAARDRRRARRLEPRDRRRPPVGPPRGRPPGVRRRPAGRRPAPALHLRRRCRTSAGCCRSCSRPRRAGGYVGPVLAAYAARFSSDDPVSALEVGDQPAPGGPGELVGRRRPRRRAEPPRRVDAARRRDPGRRSCR